MAILRYSSRINCGVMMVKRAEPNVSDSRICSRLLALAIAISVATPRQIIWRRFVWKARSAVRTDLPYSLRAGISLLRFVQSFLIQRNEA